MYCTQTGSRGSRITTGHSALRWRIYFGTVDKTLVQEEFLISFKTENTRCDIQRTTSQAQAANLQEVWKVEGAKSWLKTDRMGCVDEPEGVEGR